MADKKGPIRTTSWPLCTLGVSVARSGSAPADQWAAPHPRQGQSRPIGACLRAVRGFERVRRAERLTQVAQGGVRTQHQLGDVGEA